MTNRNRLVLLLGIGLLVVLGLGAWQLFSLATRSDDLTGPGAWPTATPFVDDIDEQAERAVVDALRAAGLVDAPILDDTGITGHVVRLKAGEVSIEALAQYATDLAALNAFAGTDGVAIPTGFWDVRTEDMRADNVTEYTLVSGLTQPELATYIQWMADSYARFVAFKDAEATGDSTDTALDIFHLTLDYLDATLGPLPDDAPTEQRQARAEQAVRMWQNVIAGTTRYNPITDDAMVAQTLSSRYTVVEMWRYDTGETAGNSQLWGVSGFADHFVGDEININQIEHMSISTFLQFILNEPLAVLNAEEELELINGHSTSEAMGRADMALNRAIADEFVPNFVDDPRGTVERMRCVLKDACGDW